MVAAAGIAVAEAAVRAAAVEAVVLQLALVAAAVELVAEVAVGREGAAVVKAAAGALEQVPVMQAWAPQADEALRVMAAGRVVPQ